MSFVNDTKSENAPPVSVVMTTYNGEAYLGAQLDSILGQSFPDFELIISDDGSTDSTLNMLRDYQSRDSRIVLIENQQNLGLHRNLEVALTASKGELIAISDQDDIWELTKLEELLAILGDSDGAFCDSLIVDSSGVPLGYTLTETLKVDPARVRRVRPCALARYNIVSGHALLFRRGLLEHVLPFDDALVFDQQIAFHAVCGRGIRYLDRCLVHHRMHANNHTNAGLARSKTREKGASRPGRKAAKYQPVVRMNLLLALDYAGHHSRGNKRAIGYRLCWLRGFLIGRLRNYDAVYIDVGLMLALYFCRKFLFHAWENGVFKKCFKISKGALYYSKK